MVIELRGPVVRSLVSANRWLRAIKTYRFPWYLTLVSTNHASSNPGRVVQFWSEIILVVSNRTRAARSFDFEITRLISDQIALHSVQLPL